MRVAGKTDAGRCRPQNEDSVLVDAQIGFLAIADGMGGYSGGSMASRIAVDSIHAYVSRGFSDGTAERAPGALLKNALGVANERIRQRSEDDQSLRGMGSTIVAALVGSNSAHVAHLGDSRAYLLRRSKRIMRLTEDHSLVQQMVSEGKISRSDAEEHRLRNVVTHCLGGGQFAEPCVTTIDLVKGDVLLLCSDGLTSMVDDEEILRLVAQSRSDVEAGCGMLMDLANKRGGRDNISVILANYM